MSADAPRNYTRIIVAIVIATLVIGAGILASSYFGSATTTPHNVATATTTNPSCSQTGDLAPPRNFAFNIAVNYTGHWNATVTGYSGTGETTVAPTRAFVDCYTGSGVGLIYLSDWNEGGSATLHVVAEKSDPGAGNLSISIKFGSSNSITQKNSTSLPYGSSTITATILGEEAVVQSATPTTTATVEAQLYDVSFHQSGACSPPVYVAPWSVTLGNETIAEPSNATLPIPGGSYAANPGYQSLSTIVFSVPNGLYQYTLSPSGAFAADSGSITVDGSDVSVIVNGPVVGCTTTTR